MMEVTKFMKFDNDEIELLAINRTEKYERKLYFNFDNFNSLVAKNVKELLTIIDSVDNEKYLDEYYKFLNSFKLSESGKSTKKFLTISMRI